MLEKNYNFEKNRIETFKSTEWISNEINNICKSDLAIQGFFFDSEREVIKCQFCYLTIHIDGVYASKSKREILEIHLKKSQNCPLLRRKNVENIPLCYKKLDKILPPSSFDEIDLSKNYECYEERLKTFINWNHSHSQNPKVLAKYGFIFTGIKDRVQCFHSSCGILIDTWEPSDKPLMIHKKLSKNCDFIMKNITF
jgi:hypothetical protein